MLLYQFMNASVEIVTSIFLTDVF